MNPATEVLIKERERILAEQKQMNAPWIEELFDKQNLEIKPQPIPEWFDCPEPKQFYYMDELGQLQSSARASEPVTIKLSKNNYGRQ